MFNSTILDVAVGLIFTFLAVSLAAGTVVEAIASALKWRSTTLLAGVKQLLNDPDLSKLGLSIYNHALVNPRATGQASSARDLTSLPSYIDPKQFADALLDVTNIAGSTAQNISNAVNSIEDPQIKGLMKGIVDRTAGNLAQMRDELASWFDSGMDRVSGVYKRKTQLWSVLIALVIAGSLNVSAIAVSKALWQQPMLARKIAPQPDLNAEKAIAELQSFPLPIGWSVKTVPKLDVPTGLELVLGWLITAFATLFGAPFWFDALQGIVRLKGSGPSPAEKQSGTGASR